MIIFITQLQIPVCGFLITFRCRQNPFNVLVNIHRFSFFSRAMVKVLKNHSYLMNVDPLLVRSCLYLIPFDVLVDFAGQVNVELLDMLVVVLNHTPADITASSVTVREAGFLIGYKFEIIVQIKIWELCFTDSVCCSGTHPRTSH